MKDSNMKLPCFHVNLNGSNTLITLHVYKDCIMIFLACPVVHAVVHDVKDILIMMLKRVLGYIREG